MSTDWYAPRDGIVRIVHSEHTALHSWLDGLDADGDVVAMVREDFAGLLADRDELAARVTSGGLTVHSAAGDDSPVISERGELSTLGALRREQQAARRVSGAHCPRCEWPASRCGCGG